MLIGLCGKKGAGKSSAANILAGWGGIEFAFAEPLKQIILLAFPWVPAAALYGTEAEKNEVIPGLEISGRRLMQTMGTEVFRDTIPGLIPGAKNIWVDNMAYRLEKNAGKFIIVSDVRFPDEAQLIRNRGGYLIRIERGAGGEIDKHPSEAGDFIPDYIVENRGTLEELADQLSNIVNL